jgi:hypothetical protein
MKARHAGHLTFETIAGMIALKHLLTSFFTHLYAILISADVLESRDRTQGQIYHNFLAESTFIKILLYLPGITIKSQVVRGCCALSTEVVMAVETSHSKLTEMFLSKFGQLLPFISSNSGIQFTRNNFHIVKTFWAFIEISKFLNKL